MREVFERELTQVGSLLVTMSDLVSDAIATATTALLESDREYRWALHTESWTESPMQLLSVEVTFPVQGEDHAVQLNTLANTQ